MPHLRGKVQRETLRMGVAGGGRHCDTARRVGSSAHPSDQATAFPDSRIRIAAGTCLALIARG